MSASKKYDIESIYTQYIDDLFIYATYLGFNKDFIMDAIHDVFCKLAIEESWLEEVDNVKFYLFASLKNRLRDICKITYEHISIDIHEPIPFDIHVNIETNLINIEEQESIKNQIKEILNTLTSRQREIIYLRYVQEYDYPQISQLLGISIPGCRKLVSKAMQSLKKRYGNSTTMD